MPNLILLKTPDGSAPGQQISLASQVMKIGRSPEACGVVLPLNAVSRVHAQIEFDQGNYLIQDLDSRNGTCVNNKKIPKLTPTQLEDGDRIKICDFLFLFSDESRLERKPLPGDFAKPKQEEEEHEAPPNSTTFATFQRQAGQQFLDTQPKEQLRAIIKIASALSRTLEVRTMLPQIGDELFEIFRQADRCFIIELEDNHLVPTLIKTRRPTDGAERFSRTIVRRCLESLEAYLSDDASSETNLGMAHSITDIRIRSVMCVPLATTDGRPLGVIQLDSQDRTKKFTQDDLKLLICVANQASLALDNAHAHEMLLQTVKLDEENKAATKVQMALLPQSTPDVPGWEYFAHYLPARTVGGDYYDFIRLQNGNFVTLVGDVSGKGVPAALIVARVSGEARVCFLTRSVASEAVRHLNELFCAANFDSRFLTLAATVLNPEAGTVTAVNSGHMPLLLYRHKTHTLDTPMPDAIGGLPIGTVPGSEYSELSFSLPPGDTLILYTDGITDAEAPSGVKFGLEAMQKAILGNRDGSIVLTPGQIGNRIIDSIRLHMGNHPQFDDIALVCYGRTKEDETMPSGLKELELP